MTENNKITYQSGFGTDLKVAAQEAISLARKETQGIILNYDGIQINVSQNMNVQQVVNLFFSVSASAGFPQIQR